MYMVTCTYPYITHRLSSTGECAGTADYITYCSYYLAAIVHVHKVVDLKVKRFLRAV